MAVANARSSRLCELWKPTRGHRIGHASPSPRPGRTCPDSWRGPLPFLVSVLVSYACVQACSERAGLGHVAKVTDGPDLPQTLIHRLGKRVGQPLASSNLASSATLTCDDTHSMRPSKPPMY